MSIFPFVGRDQEKEAIMQAIAAEGKCCILLVIGEAGMGKTWLLNQVPSILTTCTNKDSCRYGETIDLYHTPYHRSSGIEEAISRIVDPEGFATYKAKRKEYEKHRAAGMPEKALEQERADLEKQFMTDFNAITRQGVRPILRFDTVELLQYEDDKVQQICGLDPARDIGRIETHSWLLNNIPQMENTVVILAGRPKPGRFWADLNHTCAAAPPVRLNLTALSPDNAVTYFRLLAEQDAAIRDADLTEEMAREFCRLTEGRPLRLGEVALLLKERVYLAADLIALLNGIQPGPGQTASDLLDQMLLEKIQHIHQDVDTALPYIAWARKGINTRLLHLLLSRLVSSTDWPLSRCRKVLNYLEASLPFTKTRPGTNLVFLHDQMYETMKFALRFFREPERAEACHVIINNYYQPQIEKAKGPRQHDLQVEQLYYRFLANPRAGYATYAHLSDEAIIGHAVGFDMSLREEMLRFCQSDYPELVRNYDLTPEFQNRDAAVRWVKRYIARGEYEKAIEIAGQIERSSLYDPTDTFFTAALATYRGEATAYLAKDLSEACRLLRHAISQLEPVSPKNSYEEWNKDLILGRAYNDLGYVYTFLKQYENAVEESLKALPRLRRTNLLAQQAGTMTNLAYIYALQGRFDEATVLCRDALDLWQRSGFRFGEGLTWNVLGIIFLKRGIHDAARRYCNNALRIFRELQDERGEGLAGIALGQVLRAEGVRRDIHTLSKAQNFFRQADTVLNRAIHIFTESVPEHPRVVEAYNELGCVYRDWGIVLTRAGSPAFTIQEKCDKALAYLDQSIRLAGSEMKPEAADSWNDKADVYRLQDDLDAAEKCLDESDKLIPSEYHIQIAKGMPTIAEAVSGYWEILGKNSLVRGHISFARGVQESDPVEKRKWYQKAIEQYVLAGAYFGYYSSDAPELGAAFRGVYERLKERSAQWLTELQRYATEMEQRYNLKPTRIQDVFTRALGITPAYRGNGELGGRTS